jgi:CheY-like chemotaxis protein
MADKIMIVDDDQDVVNVTSTYLREGGYDVEAELDAKKALARIGAVKPVLLVLDVMFPDDSTAGFQLAREIRCKHKALPIIMVTSVNGTSAVRFGKKDIDPDWLPISEFVEKPIKKKTLLDLVAKLTAAAAA